MLLKTSLLKNVSQNRFLSNQNRYVTANEKNRLINRWLVHRIRNYTANYAQILEDAPSKSNFMMKKDNVFVVCFRFSKFFHLTKLFKLLEFFRFNCFNLRKGNTNVHVHDYKFFKKILLPLVTFILMRQICFSQKLSISKPLHCVATMRYGKQITPTKVTHGKYLSHFCS